MQAEKDLVYGSHGQRLDIYYPQDVKAVFLYFHGGGLTGGDKRDVSAFSGYLAERGIALISANYRMYPEGAYPDFLYDAAEAVKYAKRCCLEKPGGAPLYVGGSSAGGYITMMLCFDPKYLASVGLDNSAVDGYFHDAGQPTAHFTVLERSGRDSRRVIVDETAALYHVGLLEKYPPMRFIVSDNDLRCRYEQTMLLLATLSHFGYTGFDHRVMHGGHCEYCGKLENGVSVFGEMICDFIRRVEVKE